jgi:hypothetical protein
VQLVQVTAGGSCWQNYLITLTPSKLEVLGRGTGDANIAPDAPASCCKLKHVPFNLSCMSLQKNSCILDDERRDILIS